MFKNPFFLFETTRFDEHKNPKIRKTPIKFVTFFEIKIWDFIFFSGNIRENLRIKKIHWQKANFSIFKNSQKIIFWNFFPKIIKKFFRKIISNICKNFIKIPLSKNGQIFHFFEQNNFCFCKFFPKKMLTKCSKKYAIRISFVKNNNFIRIRNFCNFFEKFLSHLAMKVIIFFKIIIHPKSS